MAERYKIGLRVRLRPNFQSQRPCQVGTVVGYTINGRGYRIRFDSSDDWGIEGTYSTYNVQPLHTAKIVGNELVLEET